jgi:hypothetical protein
MKIWAEVQCVGVVMMGRDVVPSRVATVVHICILSSIVG